MFIWLMLAASFFYILLPVVVEREDYFEFNEPFHLL